MDAFVFVETPEHVEAKHCQIEKAPDDLPCKCLTCNMLIDSIDDLPDSTGRMPSIPENSTRKNESGHIAVFVVVAWKRSLKVCGIHP